MKQETSSQGSWPSWMNMQTRQTARWGRAFPYFIE